MMLSLAACQRVWIDDEELSQEDEEEVMPAPFPPVQPVSSI